MIDNLIPQPTPTIQPVSHQLSSPWLVVLLLIIVASISGGGVYFWQQNKLKNVQPVSMPPVVVLPTEEPTLVPSKFISTPRLTSLNAVWNLYTNAKSGFSIKIPKTVSPGSHNNCPQDVASPTAIFDDATGAYITVSSFYEFPVNNICPKTINSLAIIDHRANQWKSGQPAPLFVPVNWHIIVAKVNNDNELDQFIKTSWGNGCKLGAKTLQPNGVYNVKINGDGLDLSETKCPMNFALAFKYSPEFKKAATWGIGQDVTFYSAENGDIYDEEMVNSFVFTP